MPEDLDLRSPLLDLSEVSLRELGELEATVLGAELSDLLAQDCGEIDVVAGFNAYV